MSFLFARSIPALRGVFPNLQKHHPGSVIKRNYWRRRDAFSELSSAMQSVENYMKDMDRELNRAFGSSLVKLPRIFSPFDMGRVREIPVVSTEGERYKLAVDMEGMEPENINITLKDHQLTITARRDEKREDGSRFVKEFNYHYTLPSEIHPDTIRSSLTDGLLTIEASLPAIESKEIPVKVESGQKSSNESEQKSNTSSLSGK